MSGNKDVTALFRNVGRKKLDCPLCTETGFSGEYKIWEHAKMLHKKSLGDLDSPEREDMKKGFIQAALDKAQNKEASTGQPGRWGPKSGLFDTKGLVGSNSSERPLTAPGFTPNDPGKKFSNSEKQTLDQGKSMSSAIPLKRGPGSKDVFSNLGGNEPASEPLSDGRHARISSGALPTDKDPAYKREKAGNNEVVSRPAASNPKLFEPEKFNSSTNSGSRKNRSQGQFNIGHRQNTSKDFKRRQASSDGGEGQAYPQDFTTPKRILQPNTRVANPEFPYSPPGYDQYDSLQDEETVLIDDLEPNTKMLRQPETRPISHDQLVIEVKGIYAGLVMVEAKCIGVDEEQAIRAQDDIRREPLQNDQWQILIALHKQLLHEHHDFFLASQHPSASSNLSKLAAKYSMPARMWRHGIHAFLEVLRHRLPESLEHMLAFIYIAYSMMALLYETVSTFEDTWIECLGDLGRYRMAIEDDEPKDREVWSGVACFWYSKAADKNPTVGRLYHHLAILARPYSLEQLSFYTRSLTCVTPFESARGSIMTLFSPILNGREAGYHKSSSMEQLVIKAHGLMFLLPKKSLHELNDVLRELKDREKRLVEEFVEKSSVRFKRTGVFLAVSNIAALFEFGALTAKGNSRSILRRAFHLPGDQTDRFASAGEPIRTNTNSQDLKSETPDLHRTISLTKDELEISKVVRSYASDLTFSTFEIILGITDRERTHILPMVHVMLVFIWRISLIPDAIILFEKAIPWAAICSYLNHLKIDESWTDMIWDEKTFPSAAGTTGRPPPDDYIMRGQVYTEGFFPETWFADAKVDDEERMLEQSSHDAYRTIRVFWLAARICSAKRWIDVVKETNTFIITEYTTKTLTSTLEAAKVAPKVEETDEIGQMDKAEEVVTNDQDAMSDVATEEIPFNDADPSNLTDIDETQYSPKLTTRTSTGRDENVDMTVTSTVTQEGFITPRANDPEEPEDTPMRDISPGKEHTSVTSTTPARVEDSSWVERVVGNPGVSSPEKAVTEFIADPNAVRILHAEENLGDNDA